MSVVDDGLKVTKIKILFNICGITDAVCFYVTVITYFSGNHRKTHTHTHTHTHKTQHNAKLPHH